MLLFSIGELQVLRQAWDAHRADAAADTDAVAALAGKLDGGRGPRAFTGAEATLLAPAMDAWLDRLPKTIEGGVLLGQSELQIIRKLLSLAARGAP